MPPEMIPCPQCGEANSAQKQVCHHCQADISSVGKRSSTRATPRRTARPSRGPAAAPRETRKGSYALSDYIFGVSLRQRAQFYRQMYSLLNSGIALGLSLTYAADNIAYQMRGRIRELAAHVMAGGLLSEGMHRYPALFPAWEISVVLAAEKAGTLPQVMRDIADTLEMEWDLRARTRTATFHLQVTAVVAVVVGMLVSSLGAGNGFVSATGGAIDVGGVIGQVLLRALLLAVLVIVFIIGWKTYGRTRQGGAVMARILPRVPLLGPILQALARIRFVRVLSAMWHAGVSPLESLEVAARTTGNYHLMHQISDLSGHIGRGSMLSSILAATNYLPQQAMHLLQTGETTGNISGALDKIAEYDTIELEAQVKTLPVKLQLLMYAILAPVVFWLAYRVYGGYFGALLNF